MNTMNLKAFLLMMPVPGDPDHHQHRGVILAESEEIARNFALGGAETPVTIILQEIPLFTQGAVRRTCKRFPVDAPVGHFFRNSVPHVLTFQRDLI